MGESRNSTTLRKRLGIALAGLALLGVGGIATQAAFTDDFVVSSTANTGRLVVTVDSGKASVNLATINSRIFAPGLAAEDTIELVNGGNINSLVNIAAGFAPGTTTPATTTAEATTLAGHYLVTISQSATKEGTYGAPIYTGTLAGLKTAGIKDLPLTAGQSTWLKVKVELPAAVTDGGTSNLQGKAVAITLNATARQNVT